jgi:hypothetical protein
MKCFSLFPFAATLLVGSATFSIRTIDPPLSERDGSRQVMLILRGIANAENPRGQLDDEAALAYASRLKFEGEVLDIAGDTYSGNPQVEKALERIRADRGIGAIYGFSGGGYNARLIWKQLEPPHQQRILFLFDGPILGFIHEIELTIKWWYVTGEDNKEQYLKFFEPLLSRPRGSGGVLDPKYTLEGQFKPYLVQAPVKRPWLLRWLRPPR